MAAGILILGGLVLVAGVLASLFILESRRQSRRIALLRRHAAATGDVFAPGPADQSLVQSGLWEFTRGNPTAKDLSEGSRSGRTFQAFSMRQSFASGGATAEYDGGGVQLTAVVRWRCNSLPRCLVLQPQRGVGSLLFGDEQRWAKDQGLSPLSCAEAEQSFDERYEVWCEEDDASALEQTFAPDVRAQLSELIGPHRRVRKLASDGEWLYALGNGAHDTVEERESFLKDSERVAALLEGC